MPIGKAEVLEVLGDGRLRNLNFSVGPIHVNSTEYGKVADYITSGAIQVVPGKEEYALYITKLNKIVTSKSEPPLSDQKRSNLLHECTHPIADLNKLKVGRLMDEVAAYLAQIAYHRLLDPSYEAPSLRVPMNNMVRQGVDLVKKYQLGKPGGHGAVIHQSDISSLSVAIQAVPEYRDIGLTEQLQTDGVAMTTAQSEKFFHLQAGRINSKLLDDLMNMREAERLQPSVRGVAHEKYLTWDPELLELANKYACGGSDQKKAAQWKLVRIFLTIDQASATRHTQRLSALRKGDAVSEKFYKVFPADVRSAFLAALALAR